jgi:predicted O-methyltransferase YrrM
MDNVSVVQVPLRGSLIRCESLKANGVKERVNVVLGRGLDVLLRLRDAVEQGGREKFGFVFINLDKEND